MQLKLYLIFKQHKHITHEISSKIIKIVSKRIHVNNF